MRISKRKMDRFIDAATKCNTVQSTRRLIFTHCSETMELTGRYYADLVYNKGGTGILIKFKQKFFILTAQHVIDAHYEYNNPQNESPFFTHIYAKRGWNDMLDLGLPLRGWRIGELINHDSDFIDIKDIVLVELGDIFRYPDRFINPDAGHAPQGIDIRRLYEGMLLIASGYPINENIINLTYDEKFNCATVLHRYIKLGTCTKIRGSYVLKLPDQVKHDEINGMSGGLVSNVMPKANQIEWVGMIQKGGNGIIHFYPACWIIPAIKRFHEASYYEIDPAQQMTDINSLLSQDAIAGRKELYETIRSMTERLQQR